MMKHVTSVMFLILCFMWRTQTVVIDIIPEFHWGMHWSSNLTDQCGVPCIYAEHPFNPDAEFFVVMNNGEIRNAINRHSEVPLRILGSGEGQHYYSLINREYLNKHFEATALLDWTSDIPWVSIPDMDVVKKAEIPKNLIPKATFVARNCEGKNNRMSCAKVIDSVIGVIAPGSCLHNTEWPKCGDRDCDKIEVISKYKIHLAFENGDSPRYVTEKIYQAFQAGVLPVYMGTRYVAEAVPKGSYIHAADFDSPQELATYLAKVLANDTLYESYFEWKYKPFEKEFEERFRVLWSEPHTCRLCRYVEAYKQNLEWDQFKQRAKTSTVQHTEFTIPSQETRIEELNPISFLWYLIPLFVFIIVVVYFRRSVWKCLNRLP